MNRTTVLIVMSIMAILTLILVIIFNQQIALLFVVPYYSAKIQAWGYNKYLADAIAFPLAIAVIYSASQILSLDGNKRLKGTILACILWVGWCGTIFYAQKDDNWDRISGEAIRCYAPTPYGYETLSCQLPKHPKFGTPVSRITPEIAMIEATKDGAILPINKIQPKCEMTYFTVDGQPVYWYYRKADGSIDLFNHLGRHPQFNVELSPITGDIVTEICKKETDAQNTEQKKAEELKLQNSAVQTGQTIAPQPATGSTLSQQTPATPPKAKPKQSTSVRGEFSCPEGQQEYITNNIDPRERLTCCLTADNKFYLEECQLVDHSGFCSFIMKNGVPANYPENSCQNNSEQINYGFTIIHNGQARFWGCPFSWSPTDNEGCCYERVIPTPPVQCGFMLAGSAATNSVPPKPATTVIGEAHYGRPAAGPEAKTRPPTQTLYLCPNGQLPLLKAFPNCCLTSDGKEVCEIEEAFPTGRADDPQATNFIEFQFNEKVEEFYVTFYESEDKRRQAFSPRHNVMFLFVKKGVYYVNFRAEKDNWLIDKNTKVNFPMAFRINYGQWVLISSADVEAVSGQWWNVRVTIP